MANSTKTILKFLWINFSQINTISGFLREINFRDKIFQIRQDPNIELLPQLETYSQVSNSSVARLVHEIRNSFRSEFIQVSLSTSFLNVLKTSFISSSTHLLIWFFAKVLFELFYIIINTLIYSWFKEKHSQKSVQTFSYTRVLLILL